MYLAHVGSFVPAEKAIIGLTDRIFTRIATVETSALPQSSFTIDVNQASQPGRFARPGAPGQNCFDALTGTYVGVTLPRFV